MIRVMEMDIPMSWQKLINLCRLHKEYYFVTDIFDSKYKYLHPDMFHLDKKRPNLEKFPKVIVPKQTWKIWNNVIKTLYQSVRVSGFYPGHAQSNTYGIWLQHRSYDHILRNCGNVIFIKYKIKSRKRKAFCYDRSKWQNINKTALDDYNIVNAYEKEGLIFTDGYRNEKFETTESPKLLKVPYYKRLQNMITTIITEYKTKPPLPPPLTLTTCSVEFAPTLKNNIPPCIIITLSNLPAVLSRNLGRITELTNIELLNQTIENGTAIAVSNASIGTRQRSSHAYIRTTNCRKGHINGEAPVDCDPDDIESTWAECYGVLALHTWLDVLLATYALSCGEVTLYSDNKDSLCEKQIHTNLISFPQFFRPNMDIKLQIQTMRKKLKPIRVIPTHIKGHQDDHEGFEYDKAPVPVQCNIDADHASKTFLKTHQRTLEPL